MEATDYDPRERLWYATASAQPAATRPYLFYFAGKVGATVTLAAPVPSVVVASDVTLERLSATVNLHRMTASSEVVLVGADGKVLAWRDPGKLVRSEVGGEFMIAGVASPVIHGCHGKQHYIGMNVIRGPRKTRINAIVGAGSCSFQGMLEKLLIS